MEEAIAPGARCGAAGAANDMSLPHEVRADLPQEVRVRLGCALYVHPTPEIAVFAREAIQKFEAWDLVCQQGQPGWRAAHSANYWCWWRRRVAAASAPR